MLPYFDAPTIGPVTLFGIFAMLGVVAATTAALRHAERLALDLTRVRKMGMYCAIGGILGMHYFDLFLYQPGWYDADDALWRFINPFSGISSYGGMIGGTLGFLAYVYGARIKAKLRYADVAVFGVLVFMVFGRAGCASAHDHVGVATDFALAVDFPANNSAHVVGPHHDLGLYEFAMLLVLLPIAVMLVRTPRRNGWLLAVVAMAYAVPRFALDFLRRDLDNPRYAGLTPAQWGCIATVAASIGVFAWIYTHREPPRAYASPTPWRVYLRDAVRPRARSSS